MMMGQWCHPKALMREGAGRGPRGHATVTLTGPCLSHLKGENLPGLWVDQGQAGRAPANCVGEASQSGGRAGLRVLDARAGRGGWGLTLQ